MFCGYRCVCVCVCVCVGGGGWRWGAEDITFFSIMGRYRSIYFQLCFCQHYYTHTKLGQFTKACQKTEPLNYFHTSCLRKLLKIKWQDRIPDTEVLKRAGMQSIHTLLKLAQLRWTGHVARMPDERLPKKILYGELQVGKRSHAIQGYPQSLP